ncbi:MAG: glycosyltransferase family 4 protein [Anaerolineae bacterium]|nr:glycosyltransferase family 4 protein [Anaerolineae bacterium]
MSRLLIVSHTAHYRRGPEIVGWGPTVREIEQLARLFDEVVHIAPLHPVDAPASAQPYHAPNITLCDVPPAGGSNLRDKLDIFRKYPGYFSAINAELAHADAVHVRCPANIALLAILILAFRRHPARRWIKYGGTWGGKQAALTSRFQRWWLRRNFSRAEVTVNGTWPDQPPHIHSFDNPCLTAEELAEGRKAASVKQIETPVRLIFAGRLEPAKGVEQALRVIAEVNRRGTPAFLDLAGNGPDRPRYERLAGELQITDRINFHGWLTRSELSHLYTQAHISLFPSLSEGWPKALGEAMAYGIVPAASSVGSIPYYLNRFGTGRTFSPDDVAGFTEAVLWYHQNQEAWKAESELAVSAATAFSYDAYLAAVGEILGLTDNG